MNAAQNSSRRSLAAHLAMLLCSLLMAASASAIGTTANTPDTLAAQIDSQIGQPRFANASWGISIVSLDTGHTLYAHRADRLMQPASTTKLFTAALALSTLGAVYRMPTRLFASGTLHNGRLDGSLVLYGIGDPTLGTDSSADWATRLAEQAYQHGVRRVHGDLIADDSYFTGSPFGSGWEADDLQSAFAAPASALSVDENVADITIAPAAAIGQAASIRLDPADTPMALAGTVTTTVPGTATDIDLYRAPGDDTLHAFGTMALHAAPRHFKLAVPDPAHVAGEQLRKALSARGITVTGQVRMLHWPQDDTALMAHAGLVGEILSPPVMDILRRGLKRSQNLYLQNLFLSVGVQSPWPSASGTPFASSAQRSAEALRKLLAKIGLPPASSLIDEGSGLSRRDLVTPAAMVRILTYLAAQSYAAPLRDALPVAGVDGTLANQMRDTAAENNVHAKTGSMTYVQCLAGFVTSATGERLAFAIMLNNYQPPAEAPSAEADVDAIAVLLANFHGHS